MTDTTPTPGPRMLFGLPFCVAPAAEALAAAEAWAGDGPRLMVTANIDHVLSLAENPAFRDAYRRAAVRTLDGMPLLWCARARGATGAHRVTGHDLLEAVLARPVAETDRLFVVVPDAAVADGIAARFATRGWDVGAIMAEVPPFGFERDGAYGAGLAARVRAHGTTLLLMGVGAPKSEIWVTRMGAALGAPLALCVGDALAVGAGQVARAPVWMQRTGTEWFWRFLLAPRRLFHRYFVKSWRFPLLAWRDPDLSR